MHQSYELPRRVLTVNVVNMSPSGGGRPAPGLDPRDITWADSDTAPPE